MMEVDQDNAGQVNTKSALRESSVNKQSLPFVEKYRPKSLNDIVSHQEIIQTIERFIEGRKMPHLLFHGPPGTGKTSCILAIAKKLYGDTAYKHMSLELNASDDRGINVVRDQIKTFCSTQQLMSKGIKLVILDECDNMTSAAQFSLRRIVEKYSKTTRFCLICNYVSKLIPALQSRCTRFRFGPLDSPSIQQKLLEVCQSEEVTIEPKAAEQIVKLSGGDMRKVLNILESSSLSYKHINQQIVFEVTGRPSPDDIKQMYNSLTNSDFNANLDLFMQMKQQKSLALEDIVRELHICVMETQFTEQMKMFLIQRMADIEYRLSKGCKEKPQISALIGAFIEIRTITNSSSRK